MSKAFIDTVGLEKEIQVFEQSANNIKMIFEKEKRNLLDMNNGHTWVGKTQEKMYEKQVSFQNNFEPINEALEVFINFMKKTVDDYKRFEDTSNKNIDENVDNLKVNE